MNKYSYRPYKKEFPLIYQREKELIQQNIKGDYKIEHIGSTAIPGLGGKGIIDIMIGIKQDEMISILKHAEKIGYIYVPQANTPNRLFFYKPYPKDFDKEIAFHLHITDIKSKDWENALLFRDYLNTHPKDLKEYAKVKQQAAIIANGDRDVYMKAKEEVIKRILKKAIT